MTGLQIMALRLSVDGRMLVLLDATVAPGEVLTVMGPSGSGKSSLLAAIAGALPPGFDLSGRILLDGCDVGALPIERRRIGILFQNAQLFPHLSVGGNLAFGLPPGMRRAERRSRISRALQDAGLAGMEKRDPATLSGGQRARVALMRTLLAEPRALLLDEPFAGLDMALRAEIRSFVFGNARLHRLPVILVTHDAEDARAAGGRVVTLNGPVAVP